MKGRFYLILLFFSVVFSAVSCNREASQDMAPNLRVSVMHLEIDADAFRTADPLQEFPPDVTDTVIVTSTRSWTLRAVSLDAGDWISTDVTEHINVSGMEDSCPVAVTCLRHKGSQARNALLQFYVAGMDRPVEVEVTQSAFTPKLQLQCDSKQLPALDASCNITVRSNVQWTVGLDQSESTAFPEISVLSGEGTANVDVVFRNNYDDSNELKAVLVVSAPGCEDCKVELLQQKCEQFFRLENPMPAVVEPYFDKIHIPLLSNSEWHATLEESTFPSAILQPDHGTNCLNGFYLISSVHGTVPELGMCSATVRISRDGMEDILVNINQMSSLHLCICKLNPDYIWERPMLDQYTPYMSAGYPFSSPKSLPNTYTTNMYAGNTLELITKSGFTFTAFGRDCGTWISSSSTGWCVGKMKDDYLLLPAIEGFRLSGLYIQSSCSVAMPYTIRTADGDKIIEGGEYSVTRKVMPVDTEYHDVHAHIFPSTVAGERYRINLEEEFCQISIKDLCLIYEKVE